MSGGFFLQTFIFNMAVTLTIQSDTTGTDYLLENKITIVRPIDDSQYQIINSLFSPFGNTNTVEYLETYFEYASAITSIENNEVVTLDIALDVQKGNVYSFTGTKISQSQRSCLDSQFALENVRQGSYESVVCGYGEHLSINGNDQTNASNIISLAFNTTTFFEPTTKIYIFTSKELATNMVISTSYLNPNQYTLYRVQSLPTIGNYLEVDMSESQTIHFDSLTNQFEMGALS